MANAPPTNPYVGPRAFRRDEMMHGRDREARDLFDLLVSERIVLLHSPSGAGKSSLIQAALIPHLTDEDEGFRVLPLIRVNEPPRPPVVNRYIYSLLHSLEDMVSAEQRLPIETLAQVSLAEYLERRLPAQDEVQSIVFIFDQFEEILSLDPTDGDAKADFFTQVGYALRDQQRWALFAMREDYLGALEPYRRYVPTRLDNTFRLELLGPAAADQAIQQPALSRHVDFPLEAVQQLRDDLRKMRLQQPDGQTVERLGPYIEPVQLQVVCSRLWEEYGASGQITLDHVRSIGNVDEALAAYYAASVKAAAIKTGVHERLVRDWFAQHLITRQGLRGQVLREPDESGGLRNDTIEALIEEHLVRREERSGATWYELAHDRLIEPVQRDNAHWFELQLSPLQKRASEWSQQGELPELLFRGIDLAQAEQWGSEHDAELSKIERKFLKECQEARALEEQRLRNAEERAEFERQRAEQEAQAAVRLRSRNRIILGLAAVALVAAIVAVAAFFQGAEYAQGIGKLAAQVKESADKAEAAAAIAQDKQREAEAEQRRADAEKAAADAAKIVAENLRTEAERRNRSLQLADYVDDVVRPDLAFLLSLESRRIADTVEARASLLSALQSNAHLVQFLQHTPTAPLYSTAFSPDSSLIAAGGTADGEQGLIRIWRRESGELLKVVTATQPIIALTFIDQEQLAAKDLVGSLTQWNWQTGESSAFESPASLDQSNTLAVSPDGQRLAASSFNTIYLWDIASRDQIAELTTPDASVSQLAFSPNDPALLAASYSDGTLRLWNVDTSQMVAQERTPDSLPPGALTFAGSQEVVAYAPGSLMFWNTGQNITTTLRLGSTDALAVLSPATEVVATLNPTDRAMTLFDVENESRETLHAHTDQILGLAASPDGHWLASSSGNGEVVVWRVQGSPLSSEPLAVGGSIAGAIFSPDQQQIVVVDPVQITWWDRASAHILAQRSITQSISSAAANPEHDRLALGASDGTVELWSFAQQQPIGDPITGYVAPLHQLAYSSDGQWLAGLDVSGYLSVTELATRQAWQPQSDLSVGVTSIAFHPLTPSLLAVGRDDSRVELYDVAGGQHATNDFTTTDTSLVNHLAFSRDGRLLAGSAPGVVHFWDVATGAVLPEVQIEGGDVTSLLFNHDGRTLITGMSDNSIVLWDIATGRRLGTLRGHTGPVTVLSLSQDGKTLASGSDSGAVILWQIAEDEWKQIACHAAGRDLTEGEWKRYFRDAPYHATCSGN